jgi:hypothetical protein
MLLQLFCRAAPKGLIVHLRAGSAHEPKPLGYLAHTMQCSQSRQQIAPGKIAGGAKQHELRYHR